MKLALSIFIIQHTHMEKEEVFSHRNHRIVKKRKMFKVLENQRNHYKHSLQRDINLLH